MTGLKFTVVIATYDRGAAIAPTLRSVERQSLSDFEVLVVSDGPAAKGLAETVAGFGERFRLLELPTRSKSQSGPHNFAIKHAKGDRVAYLSHDDLWLPDHLASLASAYDNNPNAHFVVSGCVFLGPPGAVDELAEVTGVYFSDDPAVPAAHYFPPTSLSHRRELPGTAATWPVGPDAELPVDSAFQLAAVEQECTFVSTGRVTTMKLSSSQRHLSYLAGDDEEQLAAEEIISDPAALKEFLADRLKVAGERGNVMRHTHPAPGRSEVREDLDRRKALRGLDLGVPTPFTESVWIPAGSDARGYDWYPQENDDINKWRWSGPSPTPKLAVPRSTGGPAHVRIHLTDDAGQAPAKVLGVKVDGVDTDFAVLTGPYGHKIEFIARLRHERASVITLHTELMADERQPTRMIGIPLVGIDIETMSSAAAHPKTPGESRAFLAVRAAHNDGLIARTKDLAARLTAAGEAEAVAGTRVAELEASATEMQDKLTESTEAVTALSGERDQLAADLAGERERAAALEAQVAELRAQVEEAASSSGGGLFGRRRK